MPKRIRVVDKKKKREIAARFYQKHKKQLREYSRRYRLSHLDQVAEYNAKYLKTHRKALKKTWAAYRIANSEKIIAYRKAWYDENRKSHRTKPTKEEVVQRAKERAAKWRANNREKLRAIAKIYNANSDNRLKIKRYRIANKAKIAASSAARYAAHPEQRAAYLEATKERRAQQNAAWAAAHPEQRRSYVHMRRVRMQGTTCGELSLIYKWEKEWRSKPKATCYWCGKRSPVKACHSDHITAIAQGGAHSIENLCISCAPCNFSKSAKTLTHWNSKLLEPVLF